MEDNRHDENSLLISNFPVRIDDINRTLFRIDLIENDRCNYLRFTFYSYIDQLKKLCFLKGVDGSVKDDLGYEYIVYICTRLDIEGITKIIDLIYGIHMKYSDLAIKCIESMLFTLKELGVSDSAYFDEVGIKIKE